MSTYGRLINFIFILLYPNYLPTFRLYDTYLISEIQLYTQIQFLISNIKYIHIQKLQNSTHKNLTVKICHA